MSTHSSPDSNKYFLRTKSFAFNVLVSRNVFWRKSVRQNLLSLYQIFVLVVFVVFGKLLYNNCILEFGHNLTDDQNFGSKIFILFSISTFRMHVINA